jgi:8-oxo-dGTP pyrophosphatase MutT (NUDIX family)
MGAGVLPLALYKGTLFLLLGQERKNNLWSDFGGSTIRGEKPFKTAIREGCEELNGLLGDEHELEEQVTNNLVASISCDRYTSYIYKTTYDKKLPNYFANVNKFAEIHLKDAIENNDNGLFEKRQILWVPLNQLRSATPNSNSNSNIQLREHYKPILKSILKNEEFIIRLMTQN